MLLNSTTTIINSSLSNKKESPTLLHKYRSKKTNTKSKQTVLVSGNQNFRFEFLKTDNRFTENLFFKPFETVLVSGILSLSFDFLNRYRSLATDMRCKQ